MYNYNINVIGINTRTAVIIASTLPVVFGILIIIVVTVIMLCIIKYYCIKKKRQQERLTLSANNRGFSDTNSPSEENCLEPRDINITQSVTTISDMPHHAAQNVVVSETNQCSGADIKFAHEAQAKRITDNAKPDVPIQKAINPPRYDITTQGRLDDQCNLFYSES